MSESYVLFLIVSWLPCPRWLKNFIVLYSLSWFEIQFVGQLPTPLLSQCDLIVLGNVDGLSKVSFYQLNFKKLHLESNQNEIFDQ